MPTFYKIISIFPSDKDGFTCLVLNKITKHEALELKSFCEGRMNIKSSAEVLKTEKTFQSFIKTQNSEQTFYAHIKDHDYVCIIMDYDIAGNDIKNRLVVDIDSISKQDITES